MTSNNYTLMPCARLRCEDDGMNYCRICQMHYCFDHVCQHLESARERGLGDRALEEATQAYQMATDVEPATLSQATAIVDSEDVYADYNDAELRSQLKAHLAAAKRLQREIERRMIQDSHARYGKNGRIYNERAPITKTARPTPAVIRNVVRAAAGGKIDPTALIAMLQQQLASMTK